MLFLSPGELIGVEHLYSQTGRVLEEVNLDADEAVEPNLLDDEDVDKGVADVDDDDGTIADLMQLDLPIVPPRPTIGRKVDKPSSRHKSPVPLPQATRAPRPSSARETSPPWKRRRRSPTTQRLPPEHTPEALPESASPDSQATELADIPEDVGKSTLTAPFS